MLKPKFLIQVNYKSGTKMTFWVYKFSANNGTFTWESCYPKRPVILNVDAVESVWQLRVKRWYYLW